MQKEKEHITPYCNVAPSELSNLRWDNNGNLAQQTVYSVANNTTTYQTMRMLFWDEDDRLNLVAGDGYLSYYAYGYDGNRAIKMTGNAAIDQTGTLLNSTNLENITIYPNEYLTVTQAEYTKYYYAGGNRIASKIGTGGFEKMQRLCTEDLNLSGNANTLFGNALQQIVNITNQPNDEFPVNVCGGYSVATELLADPLPNFYINSLNLNFTQNNLLQQFRQNLTGGAEPVYYFHSDHLGSASWITNGTGAAVQHLQYLPLGEHFVNERNTAYDERFSFTGKERDAETGYYYHGARFNSSDLGWLSVDPMSDKYPGISLYAYCAWNPVKLVDIQGWDTTYYNLKANKLFTRYGGENINMMIVTDENINSDKYNSRDFHSFDVATINFADWDYMYENSENDKIEYGYSVKSDGNRTDILPGTYDKVTIPFGDDYLYDVHVHCKNKSYSDAFSISNAYPSELDKGGIGDKFGIILGYKYIQMDLSGGDVFGGGKKDSIRTRRVIGFCDKYRTFTKELDYETFKKNVRAIQK